MSGQKRVYPETQFLTSAMDRAQKIATQKISTGDTVIDATMGNGYDTVWLAELVGAEGKVYGFDIQESSLYNTKDRLNKRGLLPRTALFKDSHVNMSHYVKQPVQLIMFNLGYLPGADQSVCTRPETTVQAVQNGLTLLDKCGIMLIVNYRGHEQGKAEQLALDEFLPRLEQKQYSVACLEFRNQRNNPPALYVVEGY